VSMRDFVTDHPLFCSHTHHFDFRDFDQQRASFDFRSLLGYAHSDLMTAAGARWAEWTDDEAGVAAMWPKIRTTGYGRAVALMSQDLFGLEYCPDNFSRITQALRNLIGDRSPAEIYDELLQQKANTKWVVKDWHASSGVVPSGETVYPEYYRFSWRMDGLFSIAGCGIIDDLESDTGLSILTIDHLVEAMNASISAFRAEAPFAGLKIGMAYQRDLSVADPARHEAELAFNRIRNRKLFHRGVQQEHGAVSLLEGRPLGDYLFHGLMRRAHDVRASRFRCTQATWRVTGARPPARRPRTSSPSSTSTAASSLTSSMAHGRGCPSWARLPRTTPTSTRTCAGHGP